MGSRVVLPISVLMTSTTRGCAPTGGPASVTRGALSRPELDLPDPCGARGDGITTRPSCHPRDSPKRHVSSIFLGVTIYDTVTQKTFRR